MLTLISPAKTLDFETPAITSKHTECNFLTHSQQLIDQIKGLAPHEIASLMKLSDKLAELNSRRFLEWQQPFTEQNAKQAILAFKGDVYTGLDAESFTSANFTYAQQHLAMLSGLYGLLRPLDLIQPYRLEMGTKFANERGKDLYQFWGSIITDELNLRLAKMKTPALVNLASNEYFKAVKVKELKVAGKPVPLITPVFKDEKNGQFKIISFYAKKARGLMAQYIIKNKVEDVAGLKAFDLDGYYFVAGESDDKTLMFKRHQQD